jgi:hypothetical protein
VSSPMPRQWPTGMWRQSCSSAGCRLASRACCEPLLFRAADPPCDGDRRARSDSNPEYEKVGSRNERQSPKLRHPDAGKDAADTSCIFYRVSARSNARHGHLHTTCTAWCDYLDRHGGYMDRLVTQWSPIRNCCILDQQTRAMSSTRYARKPWPASSPDAQRRRRSGCAEQGRYQRTDARARAEIGSGSI